MVKFAHLLVLSALIVWLAGSGCIGNDASEMEGIAPNVAEAGNGTPNDSEITQAEIQELDSDMVELENLLENATPEEEILIEEL
ncbi:MAG: hypothetical protein E4H06_02680 [Methanosarcina sp.]|nr:MAG: hypothetical protein E4H06_02680 [Methanosarcina sp.]